MYDRNVLWLDLELGNETCIDGIDSPDLDGGRMGGNQKKKKEKCLASRSVCLRGYG